ncbi:hypothetical protein D9615_007581 [Tricholomella constricta]|uniref:DUF6534 domain-containing protein n=1 Tax=Tricholomella constricta TaxID=117010 RepID=A0A8H5M267_9AGAR|nr:hypothetical protein D9615_007581 [Tricholomella constricta]
MDEAPVYPRLDLTMGVVLLGVLMGASLWGICCMQTYEYFMEYRRDTSFNKWMVAILVILDTLHNALWAHCMYIYLIAEHFNFAHLNEIVWQEPCCTASLVFFVYRIWILSHHNIYAVVPVIILVVAEFAVSLVKISTNAVLFSVFHSSVGSCFNFYITALINVHHGPSWKVENFDGLPSIFRLSQSINGVAAAGDILIASTLIFILYRSKTGFLRSDSVVKQLILYSLNTGFLTSICALVSLITITIYPANFVFMVFYILLNRLYTNSLLATLNARKKLRLRAGTSEMSSDTRDITRVNKTDPPFSKQDTSHHVAIRVDTQTATGYDPATPGYDPTMAKSNNGYELSVYDDRDQAKNQEHAV